MNRVIVNGKIVATCEALDDAEALAERWLDKTDNMPVRVEVRTSLGWYEHTPAAGRGEPMRELDAAF